MNRRIAWVLAALVLPGGFVALLGAWLFRAASRTQRGRKLITFARDKVRLGRRAEEPAGFPRVPQAA